MKVNKLITYLILAFLALLFALYYFNIIGGLKDKAQKTLLSFADMVFERMSFLDYFSNNSKLRAENKRLRNEIQNLSLLKINNLALRQDLKEIKALAVKENNKNSKILRLEPSLAPRVDYLIVPESGVDAPYLLFAPGDLLLADKRSGASKHARLLSARGRVIPAYVLIDGKGNKKEKVKMELYGKGGGVFTARLNKEYKLKVGDPIYFKSHPVAVVRKMESSEQSPYTTIYAGLPINLNNLDFVLLLPYEN